MRKLGLLGLATGLLLSAPVSWAGYNWPADNPDKYPSVGLSYTGIFQSGDSKTVSTGLPTLKQDLTTTNGFVVADVRVPVSDRLSVMGGLGYAATTGRVDETQALTGLKQNASGILVNVGVRFYIH